MSDTRAPATKVRVGTEGGVFAAIGVALGSYVAEWLSGVGVPVDPVTLQTLFTAVFAGLGSMLMTFLRDRALGGLLSGVVKG